MHLFKIANIYTDSWKDFMLIEEESSGALDMMDYNCKEKEVLRMGKKSVKMQLLVSLFFYFFFSFSFWIKLPSAQLINSCQDTKARRGSGKTPGRLGQKAPA